MDWKHHSIFLVCAVPYRLPANERNTASLQKGLGIRPGTIRQEGVIFAWMQNRLRPSVFRNFAASGI